jgi:shikimate dehydrogenase
MATPQAYVIGENIAHSKSPLIHNHWLKKYSIDGNYAIKDLNADELARFVDEVRADENVKGFNVTMPHKQSIMTLLDEIDDEAAQIGAVNTVYKRQGKLIGTNTDAYGFIENLKTHMGDQINQLKSEPILLYGAGGAAKAILYGLIKEGFQKIDICNRTVQKAVQLAEPYTGSAEIHIIDEMVKNVNSRTAAFINTTSLGMSGHDKLEISFDHADNLKWVIDIVYMPLHTDILRMAQKTDIQICTGIGMLLHQAAPAFEKFFGKKPEIDKELENLVLKV